MKPEEQQLSVEESGIHGGYIVDHRGAEIATVHMRGKPLRAMFAAAPDMARVLRTVAHPSTREPERDSSGRMVVRLTDEEWAAVAAALRKAGVL